MSAQSWAQTATQELVTIARRGLHPNQFPWVGVARVEVENDNVFQLRASVLAPEWPPYARWVLVATLNTARRKCERWGWVDTAKCKWRHAEGTGEYVLHCSACVPRRPGRGDIPMHDPSRLPYWWPIMVHADSGLPVTSIPEVRDVTLDVLGAAMDLEVGALERCLARKGTVQLDVMDPESARTQTLRAIALAILRSLCADEWRGDGRDARTRRLNAWDAAFQCTMRDCLSVVAPHHSCEMLMSVVGTAACALIPRHARTLHVEWSSKRGYRRCWVASMTVPFELVPRAVGKRSVIVRGGMACIGPGLAIEALARCVCLHRGSLVDTRAPFFLAHRGAWMHRHVAAITAMLDAGTVVVPRHLALRRNAACIAEDALPPCVRRIHSTRPHLKFMQRSLYGALMARIDFPVRVMVAGWQPAWRRFYGARADVESKAIESFWRAQRRHRLVTRRGARCVTWREAGLCHWAGTSGAVPCSDCVARCAWFTKTPLPRDPGDARVQDFARVATAAATPAPVDIEDLVAHARAQHRVLQCVLERRREPPRRVFKRKQRSLLTRGLESFVA